MSKGMLRATFVAYLVVFVLMVAVALYTSEWFLVLTVGLPGLAGVGLSLWLYGTDRNPESADV